MTFLGGHPEWRRNAAAEVESLLASSDLSSPSDHSQSLSSRLAAIPLEVWESETPVLDAIIKETTRVAQPHTAMRRNLGPDVYINGKIIPTGSYVIYPFSDVHLDPELYPDPWRFNPGRNEPKEVPFAYVGWGGGQLPEYPVDMTILSNTILTLREDRLSWNPISEGRTQTYHSDVRPRIQSLCRGPVRQSGRFVAHSQLERHPAMSTRTRHRIPQIRTVQYPFVDEYSIIV